MTKNPREAAAAALVKIEKDGEYSNRALLESVRGTETARHGACNRDCYGCFEKQDIS